MHSFFHTIGLLAAHNPALAYLVLYLGVIFLGNIAVFSGLWFVIQGAFGSWGILIFIALVFAAEVSGDLAWYFLGRALRDTRLGTFLKNHIPRHAKIEHHLQKNSRRWIFLAKFLYAATFPIIFMVGWCRVEFMKFFKTSLTAIFSSIPLVLLIATILITSVSYLRAISVFRKFEWLFFAALLVFLAVQLGIATWIKFTFGRSEEDK